MALFKNLYLDLSYLNPFKKLKKKKDKTIEDQKLHTQNRSHEQMYLEPPKTLPSNLELPNVSKRLLDANISEKKLPTLELIQKQEQLTQKKEGNETHSIKENPVMPLVMPPPMLNSEIQNNLIETNPVDKDTSLNKNTSDISNQLKVSSNIQASFFSDLYHHLNSDEKIISKNISNKVYNPKLLEEMQTFWALKKEELTELKLNSALKNELLKKLNELQKHEAEWQQMQLEKEKINDFLFSKEIIIENNIKHIKKLFKKLHLATNVPSNQEFILPDNSKLSNLNELISALKTMQNEFFYFHVNDKKNDFYNWIKDVYGFNDLAEQIKLIKNKEQMAEIIDKWVNYV